MRITLHRRLADDLRTVRAYYLKEGGPKLRDRFNDEFDRMLDSITTNPKRFHFISSNLRRANFPTFPFHVLYRETQTEIRILVLRHHRREPQVGLNRK